MQQDSLFELSQLNLDSLESIFSLTRKIKVDLRGSGSIGPWLIPCRPNQIVSLVFLEPSTRTRISFESASIRLGLQCSLFSSQQGTSLVKGETLLDTIKVLEANGPDVIVLRYGFNDLVDSHIRKSNTLYINAGTGTQSHPTQGLLDVFTMQEKLGHLTNKKILFIGDVKHSRVARSNLQLLNKLNAKVAVCGPRVFMPDTDEWGGVEFFEQLQPALQWADVAMALRVQKERHLASESFDSAELSTYFQLNKETLKWLKPSGLVMHPGPFVANEEITYDVTEDPRCCILDQVENGVYIRAAVLAKTLNFEGC